MKTAFRLAARMAKVNPSSTLAITSQAKKLKALGSDVVNFAAGEPDFDTPDFIKDAAIDAIKDGFTKYTPTTGIPELKKLISEKFRRDNSLDYDARQIVVSCGAKHSIFNVLFVLLNPADEVLIPAPYWVSYPEMVNLCSATARLIKTTRDNNFKISASMLESQINPNTKVLLLNSPSNPTGSVYGIDELNEIADICVKNKIIVISDEIYEKIIYDGHKHISIASLNKDIFDLTVTVNGLSKSHSMTGWRIGYLAAPLDIAEAVSRLQDHTTSNPCSISQKAAVAALNGPDTFSKGLRQEFQKRRDFCLTRMREFKKISFIIPQGAFYIFFDISQTGFAPSVFAKRLLEETFVCLIPGESFGAHDYVRISFATSMSQLEKGMDRLGKWLEKL
jgi:aspartate aminotransferase